MITTLRRCQRCKREVASRPSMGLCKGCLTGTLTPAQREVFMAVRNLRNVTIGQVAEEIQLSRSTVYRHLRELRGMGLVTWASRVHGTITEDHQWREVQKA